MSKCPPSASAMLHTLEAIELAIVTAGTSEVDGEPCRLIHADYANELLEAIWRHIKPHTQRDPEMAALGAALARGDAS